jgi:endosialidase-like protein
MKAKMRCYLSKPFFILSGAILLGIVGFGLFFRIPQATALASNSCPKSGGNDPCTVLLVTLNGKDVPTSGITVTAKRQATSDGGIAPITIDNTVALNGKSSAPNGKQDWTNKNDLSATQYTSYYGIYDTSSVSGPCASGGDRDEGSFSITVNGAATGSTDNISLCSPGSSDGAFVRAVSIDVATNSAPATTGTISGSAQYTDTGTGQSNKNCDPSSVITITGPNNFSETVSPGTDGNYQAANLKPGNGYSAAINCFSEPSGTPGVGVFDETDSNLTVTAGGDTKANFAITGDGADATTSTPTGSSSSSSTAAATTPTCENSSFSLAWIFCSVISGAANLVTGMYTDIIQPILNQPQSSTLLDTTQPYYQVWSNLRVYGDIILVIALLVIVFGEAIGGGAIDAYTAKKVLPRLLVSAILINLSIYLVALAVDITSVLGHGIYDLFVLPFHGSSVAQGNDVSGFGLHLSTVGTALTALASGAGAIWIATAGGGFLHFLFVTVIGGGALVFFGVMITLVLRVAIILGLTFVSPVAFALYCLPNTEQYFRKWWDLLFRALLVFPIVGALFALANITALTLSNLPLSGVAQGLAQVLGLFGLFAPLIMVPFAFRMAGGAIGAIHQGVQRSITAPGLKGLAGVRAKRRQELHQRRMKAQDKLGTGRTGTFYRAVATLGNKEGWSPTGRGRRRFADYNQMVKDRAAAEMLEQGGARAFSNDDASAAAVGATSANDFIRRYMAMGPVGHTREEAQTALGRIESAIGATVQSDAAQVAAMRYRVAMSSTAYAAGPAGLQQMQTEVQDMVRRGLITTHDAVGWMKSNQGRADYSANAYQDTVEFLEGTQSAEQQLEGAFAGADARQILGGHQRAVEAFADQAARNLPIAIASGDQMEIDRAMADVANIHNALSSVSPRKADEFAGTVLGQSMARSVPAGYLTRIGVDPTSSITYREYIDRLRTDPAHHPGFHDRSREYASASAAAGAAAAAAAGGPAAGGPAAGGTASDRRLKTNIKYLETLDSGIKLYSFRYVWGGPMYVGVMAQDLLGSHAEAVITGLDGYYYVNYDLLGIKMIRFEEFLEVERIQA